MSWYGLGFSHSKLTLFGFLSRKMQLWQWLLNSFFMLHSEKKSFHIIALYVVSNYSQDHEHYFAYCCFSLRFVRLAEQQMTLLRAIEVRYGEAWIPVSDGNFTLPTAQVTGAEFGGKAALSWDMPFRESGWSGLGWRVQVWSGEPELWSCSRVPVQGAPVITVGVVQVVLLRVRCRSDLTSCSQFVKVGENMRFSWNFVFPTSIHKA